MLSVFYEHENAGIVGAKLLYKNNAIQHAGIDVINRDNNNPIIVKHRYKNVDNSIMKSDEPEKVDAITGACLLIKRDIFDYVGGFDEQFLNSYEDIDLCCKVFRIGLDIFYQPKSVVYHYEGLSKNRYGNEGYNFFLFNEKWRKSNRAMEVRDVYVKNKFKFIDNEQINILFIAPTTPTFDRDSGGNRFLEILRIL